MRNETIDLKFNYPSATEVNSSLQQYFSQFCPSALSDSLPPYGGERSTRNFGRKWLNLPAHAFASKNIVLCNSGNHALTCILQSLRSLNTHIITEPFTYPAFKSIALQNQYEFKCAVTDKEGITVESLKQIMHQTKCKLLYIQPTIHNPTCHVTPLERRLEIAKFAKENELIIIEDDAYRFLCENPPPTFLELLPEQTFHIYSLSKPFTPSIKTTFVAAPISTIPTLIDNIRLTSSGNSSLLNDLSIFVMQSGSLNDIIKKKRALASKLQKLVRNTLDGLSYTTHPTSFHIWLCLPATINATTFTAQLAKQNIVVSSGVDFAVGSLQEGEAYIRIALGAEKNMGKLEAALIRIKKLLSLTT